LDLLQQAPDGDGANVPMRERTLVPAGHNEIDAMGLRAGCDGPGGFSNPDVDTVRQVAAPQPLASLGLEMTPGARSLRFDDSDRKPAVDDVQDDQMAASLERKPGRSHEGDFRLNGEIVCQEHPIHSLCEARAHELQAHHVTSRSIGGAQIARSDAGNGCANAGRVPENHGLLLRLRR
jgi:hypothetical protein